MKVYVTYHLEAEYEITIVAVFDSEEKAKAYVAEYEKGNKTEPNQYRWKFADYDELEVI